MQYMNVVFSCINWKGHGFDIDKSGIPVNPIIVRSVYTMILTRVY